MTRMRTVKIPLEVSLVVVRRDTKATAKKNVFAFMSAKLLLTRYCIGTVNFEVVARLCAQLPRSSIMISYCGTFCHSVKLSYIVSFRTSPLYFQNSFNEGEMG